MTSRIVCKNCDSESFADGASLACWKCFTELQTEVERLRANKEASIIDLDYDEMSQEEVEPILRNAGYEPKLVGRYYKQLADNTFLKLEVDRLRAIAVAAEANLQETIHSHSEFVALRLENERLQQIIDDRFLDECAYCGQRFLASEIEQARAHVLSCPDHPLVKEIKRLHAIANHVNDVIPYLLRTRQTIHNTVGLDPILKMAVETSYDECIGVIKNALFEANLTQE